MATLRELKDFVEGKIHQLEFDPEPVITQTFNFKEQYNKLDYQQLNKKLSWDMTPAQERAFIQKYREIMSESESDEFVIQGAL